MGIPLDDVAESWYQRLHSLRVIWQDDNEPFKRRRKALLLWDEMCQRMQGITNILLLRSMVVC